MNLMGRDSLEDLAADRSKDNIKTDNKGQWAVSVGFI